MLLNYLAKRGNTKNAFSLKCYIVQHSLLDFFSLFNSRLILTLLYDSLNFVINEFSSELLGGMVQQKKSSAAAVGLCCTHNAPCALSFLFRKVMLKH